MTRGVTWWKTLNIQVLVPWSKALGLHGNIGCVSLPYLAQNSPRVKSSDLLLGSNCKRRKNWGVVWPVWAACEGANLVKYDPVAIFQQTN